MAESDLKLSFLRPRPNAFNNNVVLITRKQASGPESKEEEVESISNTRKVAHLLS